MPVLNLRLPASLARKLEAVARAETRTPAEQALHILKQALERQQEPEQTEARPGREGGDEQ